MNKIKQLVQKTLANLARKLISKYQPIVIGITGSVGKTSTRDACYWALQTKYRVRKPEHNLNNEFGLPLAILGFDSPGRNIFGWIRIFLSAYAHKFLPLSFPEVLILEMGVDKPGDMDYLLGIVVPDIAVVTYIGSAHYEFFETPDGVANEKLKLPKALREDGIAILNIDNQIIKERLKEITAKTVTYSAHGAAAGVSVQLEAEYLEVPVQSDLSVKTNKHQYKISVPAVGAGHIASSAAAIAVASSLKVTPEQIKTGLAQYECEPGRMRFIRGVRKTLLIEDSYNASPDSMRASLKIFARVNRDKKIAVLGDMLELGSLSEPAHKEIGELVAKLNLYKLFTVGKLGKIISDSAVAAGFDQEQVLHFETSSEAAKYIQQNIVPEAAILIKGSQGVRMERVSKELLLEPMSAYQVLPRQYGSWLGG